MSIQSCIKITYTRDYLHPLRVATQILQAQKSPSMFALQMFFLTQFYITNCIVMKHTQMFV